VFHSTVMSARTTSPRTITRSSSMSSGTLAYRLSVADGW
jgi:hypothetical protein